MAIIIRFLVESDFPQWYIIHVRYLKHLCETAGYPFTATEESCKGIFARLLDPKRPMYGIIAEDDETHTVVGMANISVYRHSWTVTHYVLLNDLFVNETHRNHQIGRKLIERVYQYADDNKYSNVHWMCMANNHQAQLLYTKIAERSGFVSYAKPDAEEQA